MGFWENLFSGQGAFNIFGGRDFSSTSKDSTEYQMFEENKKRYEENISELFDLIPEYQKQFDQSTQNINNLFANAPNLNLDEYSNQLHRLSINNTGISNNLNRLSDKLSGYGADLGNYASNYQDISNRLGGISSSTTSDINKYLSSGEDYISSMLSETEKGASDYLSGYKRLAREEMPGLSLLRSQESQNLGSSLQQLKSMGVSSPNAIANVLSSSNRNRSNLGLAASNYKAQALQKLPEANLISGTTRAGAYSTASGLNQNIASARAGLGSFQAGIEGQRAGLTGEQAGITSAQAGITGAQAGIQGQRAGILGAQAEIAGQRAGLAQNEYEADFANTLTKLQWNQTMAQMFNPLDFAADVYGNAAGIGWAGQQSALQSMQQSQQSQQQTGMGILGLVASLFA